MGSKPKTPAPTAAELEADRRTRKQADDLTREENYRLKNILRGRGGRRSLLGSSGEQLALGIRQPNRSPGPGASGSRGGGGNVAGGVRSGRGARSIMSGATRTTQGRASSRAGRGGSVR